MKKIRGFGSIMIKLVAFVVPFVAVLVAIAIGLFIGGKIIIPIILLAIASCGIFLFSFLFFGQPTIVFCKNEICFFSLFQKVLINGKYTYKNRTKYLDIVDIRLIHSHKASDKKYYPAEDDSKPPAIHLHLEFVLEDESTKWFTLSLFSDKQRAKIIKLINSKTGLTKSYNQLVRELLIPQVDGKIDLQ